MAEPSASVLVLHPKQGKNNITLKGSANKVILPGRPGRKPKKLPPLLERKLGAKAKAAAVTYQ